MVWHGINKKESALCVFHRVVYGDSWMTKEGKELDSFKPFAKQNA